MDAGIGVPGPFIAIGGEATRGGSGNLEAESRARADVPEPELEDEFPDEPRSLEDFLRVSDGRGLAAFRSWSECEVEDRQPSSSSRMPGTFGGCDIRGNCVGSRGWFGSGRGGRSRASGDRGGGVGESGPMLKDFRRYSKCFERFNVLMNVSNV